MPNHPLTCLGDFLLKFSEKSDFPVSVRSIEKGHATRDMKILLHNKASVQARGFKEGGKVGMTIPEVLDHIGLNECAKAEELERTEKNDQEAIINNCQSTQTQITLGAEGFIRVFQRIVTPLGGNKPVAISTVSLELTQFLNLFFLLQLYKKYYKNEDNIRSPKALKKFLQYLKFDKLFIEELSEMELITLLAMVRDPRHKQAAKLVTTFKQKPYSSRTVSTYVDLIKDKLKPHIDLSRVLSSLRDYHQLQPTY